MAHKFTHKFDSPLYTGTASVNTGLFIDDKFVDAVNKETVDVLNPVNGRLITKVACASAADVDLAVQAAKRAYKTTWGLKVPGYDRGQLLAKLADLTAEHLDELSALEALDAGKHFTHTKYGEIPLCIKVLRYFAGWADKNHGQTIESSETKLTYTRHEPIGVCGLITPWNFPLVSVVCKLAPALATGNTVVVKPSENTPLSALRFAELVSLAGFPPGVVNIVPGYGPTAGQALTDHVDVLKISFTGSTIVGRKIMETSAKTNLKRVTLELGGKSPTIIFDDANFEQALNWAVMGIFHNSGQMCAAGSRIYVQESIYDRFVESLTGAAQAIKHGDGFDPNSQQGPLISKVQLQRVMSYIESGKQAGANLVTGGTKQGDAGYFVLPTIFTDVKPDMKIVREEIFGPVAVVIKFKSEQEVIDLANDTVYGLSSMVFSENISRALRVAHALESGQSSINCANMGDVGVPFGGMKQSGFGRELGQYGLEVFTSVKAVHVNIAALAAAT